MSISKLETIVIEPALHAQHTVIWLHGLGADGHDFVDIVPALGLPKESAVRFIFPHAPVRPVTLNAGMHMRAWFDIFGLTLDAKIDEAGIKASDQAIAALIAQEQQRGIAANKIVLAGFSQGGAIALFSGLTYPQPLAGIIGLSTFLPTQHFQNNPSLSIQRDIPIFMAHGEFDPIVAINLGVSSKDQLVKLGCKVEWHTYPMPHSVCPQEIEAIGAWLKKSANLSDCITSKLTAMKAIFNLEKSAETSIPAQEDHTPRLIAIDWGTSNFRAFLLTAQGKLLEKKFARQGILRVHRNAFAQTLHKQIKDWLVQYPNLPVIMAGMIGSRQGWQEVPYLLCPLSINDLAKGIHPVPHTQQHWIIPGLRIDYPDGRVDVMRGEETQILGAISDQTETQLFCLPGTHSKWAILEKGRLTRFSTFMTGEVFTLLAKHSILGKLMRNTKPDTDGFLKGVAWAERDDFLLSQLFQVRTQVLAGMLDTDDVYGFLSGLLIGHEIKQILASPLPVKNVTLIANPSIARVYARALKEHGMSGIIKDVDQVTIRGLFKIATEAGIMTKNVLT